MGDFEDTFGAGADAAEIINGNSHFKDWNDTKSRWHEEYLKRQAKLQADPEYQEKEAQRIAYEAQREAERAATPWRHTSPILSDEQQDARHCAIETAKRGQAEREEQNAQHLGLPNQAQIDRAVALAKASEERMEALIREAEAKKS